MVVLSYPSSYLVLQLMNYAAINYTLSYSYNKKSLAEILRIYLSMISTKGLKHNTDVHFTKFDFVYETNGR